MRLAGILAAAAVFALSQGVLAREREDPPEPPEQHQTEPPEPPETQPAEPPDNAGDNQESGNHSDGDQQEASAGGDNGAGGSSGDDDHAASGSSGGDDHDASGGGTSGDDDHAGDGAGSSGGGDDNSGDGGGDHGDTGGGGGGDDNSGDGGGDHGDTGGGGGDNDGAGSGSTEIQGVQTAESSDVTQSAPASSSANQTSPGRGTIEISRSDIGSEYAAREIVVVADEHDMAALAQSPFAIVDRSALPALGRTLITVRIPDGADPQATLRALQSRVPASAADLDHIYRLTGASSRPVLATDTRPAAVLESAPIVGLIDTAVDPSCCGQSVVEDRAFVPGTRGDRHGTEVAQILALHGVRVLSAAVFVSDQAGNPAATVVAIVRAMDWMADHGIRVVNLSFTGPRNAVLRDVIRRYEARGMIFVAAAGNDGPAAPPAYPAAEEGVVGVTAVDASNQPYRHANQGDYIAFAALGVNVSLSGRAVSGTSFAAPVVAAAIARSGNSDAAVRLKVLAASAVDLGAPGRDPVFGYGLVR